MFHFAIVSRREPLADPEHTLGIEVTDASLAAQCRLGNIDPQHGGGSGSGLSYDITALGRSPAAACNVAALVPLPPDGTTLVTSCPDVDNIAAMAVLVLRHLHMAGRAPATLHYAERLDDIAMADAEGAIAHCERFGALAVICSPNHPEYDVTIRVAIVACWLLWGDESWSIDADDIATTCGLSSALGLHEIYRAAAALASVSLLALHAAVLAARDQAAQTWPAVEAHRGGARPEHARDGRIWCECEWCATDARLCRAHDAAERAHCAANAELAAALKAADWGRQPDGSFVTRCAQGVGSMRSLHTLHAPAKGGPLAVARDARTHLCEFRTREEARDIREKERERNRDGQAAYNAARLAAGAALARGEALPYWPGQEFGRVAVGDRHVSARGALRAAGLTREAAEVLLSSYSCSDYSTGLMLSLRGVTGQ